MQPEQHAQSSATTKEKPGCKGTCNTNFQTSLLPTAGANLSNSKNKYQVELEIKVKGVCVCLI